jgi:hypothetical protein
MAQVDQAKAYLKNDKMKFGNERIGYGYVPTGDKRQYHMLNYNCQHYAREIFDYIANKAVHGLPII